VNRTDRQIIRHASIFGLGAILFRLASIVLLPLYTHYLSPADYGVMAILDLTINLLAILAGAGVASAATRAHFNAAAELDHDHVWWTAIVGMAVVSTVVVLPPFVLRDRLAFLVFGPGLPEGPRYLAIALPTLWLGSVTLVVDAYFRARKASYFVVGVGLTRLVVNVLLNVTFLVYWEMGLEGILWGNLVSAGVAALAQGAAFLRSRHQVQFSWPLARTYWRFGWPLVVYGVLSAVMHEADRYVLRLFVTFHEVGLYSVAYQIGQAVNTLVMTPFLSIWGVMIYEIANEPDARGTYARVFKYYCFGLSLVLLFASLFARPILQLLAPVEYAPAADIVPVVCLAYLFFSMHDHFKVPALLRGRTTILLPIVSLAALSNIGLNLLLVPQFGAAGAAWASVLTFAIFAFGGLLQYRRIDRYEYPFAACALAIAGMVTTYIAHRALVAVTSGYAHVAWAAVIWIGWVVVLFRSEIQQLGRLGVGRIYFLLSFSGLGTGSRVSAEPPVAVPGLRDRPVAEPTLVPGVNDR
jgi:O-antigen/teichoic acid export membrane protein